ncbi:ARM repeat-containing protein [Delitschia confertaspora ATCC 74209]|uniref:ARM repeat-containing protein n=1 Tax=Delitschia confertaspora ATCC 74209 TaxID=1513339 RepID=A0A9P4JL97_9PLEO|nr:ARM repeat-containing protein [Delitschia confertaspora ATCC 74209]
MGRTPISPAIVELINPNSTPDQQVQALRDLKNEIVGHEQRKELAVRQGVVRPLVEILRAEGRRGGKRKTGVINGSGSFAVAETAQAWDITDEMRYQATLVVGSLALGGPAFAAPLLAANVLPPLLEALSPNEVSLKLIIPTLRSLLLVVDATSMEKPVWTDSTDGPLRKSPTTVVAQHIYTLPVMENLAEILRQASPSPTVQLAQSLVMQLISKTCYADNQQEMLLEAGILNTLATKLSAIALEDAQYLRLEPRTPSPDAMDASYLGDILEAISVIIKDSNYRTARFLYSPSIRALFPSRKDNQTGTYEEGNNSAQGAPWEKLIPRLHCGQYRSDPYSKTFPPLGTLQSQGDRSTRLPGMDYLQQRPQNVAVEEYETSLVSWLIHIARKSRGPSRLATCWLLGVLKTFSDAYPSDDPSTRVREKYFSYLVVPLVMKMIEDVDPTSQAALNSVSSPTQYQENRLILETAPLVLAELIKGDEKAQLAAVNGKIIPVLCNILKKSFDPVLTNSKPLWAPKPASATPLDPNVDPVSSTMGKPGLGLDLFHALKYRLSALKAIAAIADSQDAIRKQFFENGTFTCIHDSLIPIYEGSGDLTAKTGNPPPVLIAACEAVRSLSRSVSNLRTSLIDNGIAKPISALLVHPNVEVQIAATSVLTNLVLDFSPMRDQIISLGAVKNLCDHCHSANYTLRLESLWALKHMCMNAGYDVKMKILEELGVGWLVQVLSGEPRDISTIMQSKTQLSTPIGMGTPNAAGEQVDILNAVDDPRMDVDEESSSEEDEHMTGGDNMGSFRHRELRPPPKINPQTRLKQLKDLEQDMHLKAVEEDLRIQEQALDLIRNWIYDTKNPGQLIDHLLNAFDQTRFFELIDSKLRPRASVSTPFPEIWDSVHYQSSNPHPHPAFAHTQHPQRTSSFQCQAHAREFIYHAALNILLHIANGHASHRSLLLSQTQLMNHVLPMFTHPNREIRLACAYMMSNLTFVEDQDDKPSAEERAVLLRGLGFEDAIKGLAKDADQDVKERGKMALDNIRGLLDNTGVRGFRNLSAGEGTSSTGPFGENAALRGGFGSLHPHRTWGRD